MIQDRSDSVTHEFVSNDLQIGCHSVKSLGIRVYNLAVNDANIGVGLQVIVIRRGGIGSYSSIEVVL